MYGCESRTIKKAEHQRIDAFELCCWRRLLRVPWTARRSNQSILKETSPGCSLERLMLKLQYFGHLMGRSDSLEKTVMLGKIEEEAGREGDDRGWDGWTALLPQWTWVWASSRSWWWTGKPGVLQTMGSHRVGYKWMTELTDRTVLYIYCVSWVPRLTLLYLRTNWTYERVLWMELLCVGDLLCNRKEEVSLESESPLKGCQGTIRLVHPHPEGWQKLEW